jgi:hypothetical protein
LKFNSFVSIDRSGIEKRVLAFVISFVFTFSSVAPVYASSSTSSEIDYSEIGEVGEACFDTLEKNPSYASLANQLFVFQQHPKDNSKQHLEWSARSKSLQSEILKHKIDWTDLYWLRSEATQIYINQLIYNWKLQSEIFRPKTAFDVGELSDDPAVQKGIATANKARKEIKDVPSSWDEKEFLDQARAFNAMVDGINTLCTDSNLVYRQLMEVYNKSELQNWETNEYLPVILGSQESNAMVDGGIKGIVRKRTNEIRTIASWEAAVYEGVMGQTMFGKMYAFKTPLKNHVGSFNQKSCVEYGEGIKKLPEDKKELWKLVGNSYASIHNEYQKNLSEVVENAKEKTTEELLKDYIQSNPTSIQQALLATSSKPRAMSTCLVLHSLKRDNSMKEAVASVLSPVAMLATLMTGGTAYSITGSVVAYSALVLNTYFVGSTIMDVVASKNLESRIQGALLSEQIDPAVGKDMVAQLQSTRPMSYINIALGGLGATAAGLRAAKTSKGIRYQEYLVGKGGATAEGFARVSKSFVEKGSKPFTRQELTQIAKRTGAGETSTPSMAQQMKANAKNAPQPQGVKHDLGGAKLENYLNFIKNEKGSGTGPSSNHPGSYGYTKPPANQPGPSGGYKAVTTEPAVSQTSKVQTSTPVTKPSPKSGVKAKMELEPDVVPMPVEPHIVPMPVQPYVVEPAYAAKGNEKLKKDLEPKKKDLQRQAEQAIENDQDVADAQVRTIIENIAREQGRLGGLARDWLAKHGGLARKSYDGGNTGGAGFNSSSKNSNNPYSMEQVLLQIESKLSDETNYMMLGAIYELSQKDNELGQKARDWLAQHAGSSLQHFSVGAGENPFYALLIHNDPQHGDWDGTDIVLNMILAGKTRVDHGSLDGALRFAAYSGETKILKKVLEAANFQKQPFSSEEISRSFEGTGYYNYPGASSTKVRTENAKALVKYAQENNFSISMESIQRAMKASAQDPDKEFYEFCEMLVTPLMSGSGEKSDKSNQKSNAILIEQENRAKAIKIIQSGKVTSDKAVIEWIRLIGKGKSTESGKARDWLNRFDQPKKYTQKPFGRSHYDGSASLFLPEFYGVSDVSNKSNPFNGELFKDSLSSTKDFKALASSNLTPQQVIEFLNDFHETEQLYNNMQTGLSERGRVLDDLVNQGVLDEKTLKEQNIRENFYLFQDESISEFKKYNEITKRINAQDQIIAKLLTETLQHRGFHVFSHQKESHGPVILKIIPGESTEFYNTMKRLAGGREDFSKKYSLYYNPLSLHASNAALYVTQMNAVTFGLPTIQLMVMNEMSSGEKHELRHLYFSLLREKKKDSLYHQSFKWAEGDLVPGKTYNHYLSAEEIAAYANNLKIAVEHLRETGEEDSLMWANENIYYLSRGILESTNDFLTSISKNIFSVHTNDYLYPLVRIDLPNGKKLQKPMVSPEDRTLFQNYIQNKGKYEVEIMRNVYNAQFRLNHVAYQQVIAATDLQKKIKIYTDVVEAFREAQKADFTPEEYDSLEKQVEYHEKGLITHALKMFQASKETHPNFATLSEKKNEYFSPLLVKQMFDPEMIVSVSKVSFPNKKSIAQSAVEKDVNASAKNSRFPSQIHLYRDGLRVKNYDQLIQKSNSGDVLHFGAQESFVVDRYLDGYTHWHLILLQDGKVLRLPKAKITKSASQSFLKKQKEWSALGIPVLAIVSQPGHGRYIVHEDIATVNKSENLRDYQKNKNATTSAADQAVVEFAKKVASLPRMKNFILDQVVYAKGQWKIIVTGLETPDANAEEGSSIFDDDWIIFVDNQESAEKMKKAMDEKRSNGSSSNALTQTAPGGFESWENTILEMKKNIPMFAKYYDSRVLLTDTYAFLNERYYLKQFYEIYKNNPGVQASFSQDYKPYEFERIVKQIVDSGPGAKGENWSDILMTRGNKLLNPSESIVQQVDDLFHGYDPSEIWTHDYFKLHTDGQYFFAGDQFFIVMTSSEEPGKNVIMYLDEINRTEFNQITKKMVKELDQVQQKVETSVFPENYFEQHYQYSDENVRVSRDGKFLIIKAMKLKPEGKRESKFFENEYFLFIQEPNESDPVHSNYRPLGKIDRTMFPLLQLTRDDFSWVNQFSTKMKGFNPQVDPADLNSRKDIETAKKMIKPSDQTMRFYMNDETLGLRIPEIPLNTTLTYDPLYVKNRHDFYAKKNKRSSGFYLGLCIVVIDSKYYYPTLNGGHFMLHNPDGYDMYDVELIDGVTHVYLRDAAKPAHAKTITNPKRPDSIHSRVSGIADLAKEAKDASKMGEQLKKIPNKEDVIDKLAFKAGIYAATDSSVEEHAGLIRANHYFDDEIDNIQTDVWEEVNTTILLRMEYADIDQNQVVLILYRAHMSGNDEKPRAGKKISDAKTAALAKAKDELEALGYTKKDAGMVVGKLADAYILGVKPESSSSALSDQKFLDHLKLEVEDLTSTRDNPFALARGLLTFFEGIPDEQVRTFTNWLKSNYNYAIHWGKNSAGSDWGMSHMQMWPKSEYGSKAVPKETQMTFLVNQKGKPYVLVNRNHLDHGTVYAFDDLVANLDRYIQEEKLVQGKPSPQGKYYYQSANAKQDVTIATSWNREEYPEDELKLESIPAPTVVMKDPNPKGKPTAHIQFVDEFGSIANLGQNSTSASELIHKIREQGVSYKDLLAKPITDHGSYRSVRVLKLKNGEEYYYKMLSQTSPESATDYQLTELEYAVYLIDQALTQRYAKSFLLEVDHELIFFSEKEKEVQFNYTDRSGKKHQRISLESMVKLYDPGKMAPTPPVKYPFPSDVILLDFILGHNDRTTVKNIMLRGSDILNYRASNTPLTLPNDKIKIGIFDGGEVFTFDPKKVLADPKNFTAWYENYQYDEIETPISHPKETIYGLINDNPKFMERLNGWKPAQIKKDLSYLSKSHVEQFIKNRNLLLKLEAEARASATKNQASKKAADGLDLPGNKAGSMGKGDYYDDEPSVNQKLSWYYGMNDDEDSESHIKVGEKDPERNKVYKGMQVIDITRLGVADDPDGINLEYVSDSDEYKKETSIKKQASISSKEAKAKPTNLTAEKAFLNLHLYNQKNQKDPVRTVAQYQEKLTNHDLYPTIAELNALSKDIGFNSQKIIAISVLFLDPQVAQAFSTYIPGRLAEVLKWFSVEMEKIPSADLIVYGSLFKSRILDTVSSKGLNHLAPEKLPAKWVNDQKVIRASFMKAIEFMNQNLAIRNLAEKGYTTEEAHLDLRSKLEKAGAIGPEFMRAMDGHSNMVWTLSDFIQWSAIVSKNKNNSVFQGREPLEIFDHFLDRTTQKDGKDYTHLSTDEWMGWLAKK